MSIWTKILGWFTFPMYFVAWFVDRTLHIPLWRSPHVSFWSYIDHPKHLKMTIARIIALSIIGSIIWLVTLLF